MHAVVQHACPVCVCCGTCGSIARHGSSVRPTPLTRMPCVQFDIVNCYGNYASNAAQQGQTPSKQWCEVDTANWIIANTLPQNNITGTPQQPMSLDPTVTAPPPPPPPPPPFPPPPMVEPIQLVAVDDPFAPVTPAGGTGAGGLAGGAQDNQPADVSPGERGIVEEDSAHGLAAAAAASLAAAAAVALLL